MAGDLTTILEEVRTRLEELDFVAAAAVFDFEDVPDSVADKSYRIETKLVTNEYGLGNRAHTTEAIEIYVVYALKNEPVDAWEQALDDRETIEKDIVGNATIAALAQGPILTLNQEAAAMKYLDNYLVSKVVFRCDYIRDLTPAS